MQKVKLRLQTTALKKNVGAVFEKILLFITEKSLTIAAICQKQPDL